MSKPRETRTYVTVVVVRGVAGRAEGDVMTLPPAHAARWVRRGWVRYEGPSETKPDGPSETKEEGPEETPEEEPGDVVDEIIDDVIGDVIDGGVTAGVTGDPAPLTKRHKGGGWYEILDGGSVVETIQGRAAADLFIENAGG